MLSLPALGKVPARCRHSSARLGDRSALLAYRFASWLTALAVILRRVVLVRAAHCTWPLLQSSTATANLTTHGAASYEFFILILTPHNSPTSLYITTYSLAFNLPQSYKKTISIHLLDFLYLPQSTIRKRPTSQSTRKTIENQPCPLHPKSPSPPPPSSPPASSPSSTSSKRPNNKSVSPLYLRLLSC